MGLELLFCFIDVVGGIEDVKDIGIAGVDVVDGVKSVESFAELSLL